MAMMKLLLMMMLLSSLEEKGQRQWGRGRLHQTMTVVDLVVVLGLQTVLHRGPLMMIRVRCC